jgi:hypothetical protein
MIFRPLQSAAFSVLLLAMAAGVGSAQETADGLKQLYKRPLSIPFPASAPYSPQMATLGKMLFFDPRLSGAQNLSCASCHNPSFGYEVPVPGAIGAANKPLGRKAPTVLNAAYTPIFFWDGRAKDLEEQAQGPITASAEMLGKFSDIIIRLNAIPEYKDWFGRLFPGDGVSKDQLLTAIATYERTVVTVGRRSIAGSTATRPRSPPPPSAASGCSTAKRVARLATPVGISPTTNSTMSVFPTTTSVGESWSPAIRWLNMHSRRRVFAI